MTPLSRLKAFVVPKPVNQPSRPKTFTWEGVTYDTPSIHTEQTPGFWFSTRGKAWKKYQESLP